MGKKERVKRKKVELTGMESSTSWEHVLI